jgi:hypothetical protein
MDVNIAKIITSYEAVYKYESFADRNLYESAFAQTDSYAV